MASRGFRASRIRFVVGFTVAMLLFLTLVLWWAGTRIRSTGEAQALAQPPAPALITTPVRSMVVRSTLTLTGAVVGGALAQVGPPVLGGGLVAVVTRVPVSAGMLVRPGRLLADVSGRPVFVLQGAFPMYRPMTRGIRGPDVAELQAGLWQAGYPVDDPPGYFGSSTISALSDLYHRNGYYLQTDSATAAAPATRKPALRRQGGWSPVLPIGEIAFVPHLPAEVASVIVRAGVVQPGGPILTLSAGLLRFQASLAGVAPGQIRPGMKALVAVQGAARPFPATVTAAPGASAASSSAPNVTLQPARQVARSLAGESAEVVITTSVTPGPVLAVPLGALRSAADGSPAVGVVRGSHVTQVLVQVGEIGDGYVQITGRSADISPGMLVLVASG